MAKDIIDYLIREGYLKTPRIIKAFKKIKREDFVLENLKPEAEDNIPLPIGYGQTISQPLTVGFMLELLQPKPGDRILDIGSGSGWQTAILSYIVGKNGKVFAMERIPELADFGKRNVAKYSFIKKGIAKFVCGNGAEGLKEQAPFDKIIAAASAEKIPDEWKKQLKIGGRIVAPVQSSIWLLIKEKDKSFIKREYPGFVFVPLIDD